MIIKKIAKEIKRNFVPMNNDYFEDILKNMWDDDSIEIKNLINHMKKTKVYLEYGMGKSTILAAQYVKKEIYSVESDRNFLNACKNFINKSYKNNKINFIHANIGLTTDFGYPLFGYKKRHFGFSFGGNKTLWSKYSSYGWDKLKEKNIEPDLIFIDGRFRVACVLESIMNLRDSSDCILALDDYRPHYKSIEPFIKNKKLVGKTLFFSKKRNNDLKEIKNAFSNFKTDPR